MSPSRVASVTVTTCKSAVVAFCVLQVTRAWFHGRGGCRWPGLRIIDDGAGSKARGSSASSSSVMPSASSSGSVDAVQLQMTEPLLHDQEDH
jgi:hypothetical protein